MDPSNGLGAGDGVKAGADDDYEAAFWTAAGTTTSVAATTTIRRRFRSESRSALRCRFRNQGV